MPLTPCVGRDALRDGARDLCWKKGWAGASMKDLEKALGLKPGSFYAAFGSKNALFELTLDRYADAGVARLTALAEDVGALEALKQHPMNLVSTKGAASKACMLAKTVLELKDQEGGIADRADAHLDRMEQLFADLFRQAQAAGDIDPELDADRLARRYQSDLLGLRMSAERGNVDAAALAKDLGDDLARLAR